MYSSKETRTTYVTSGHFLKKILWVGRGRFFYMVDLSWDGDVTLFQNSYKPYMDLHCKGETYRFSDCMK